MRYDSCSHDQYSLLMQSKGVERGQLRWIWCCWTDIHFPCCDRVLHQHLTRLLLSSSHFLELLWKLLRFAMKFIANWWLLEKLEHPRLSLPLVLTFPCRLVKVSELWVQAANVRYKSNVIVATRELNHGVCGVECSVYDQSICISPTSKQCLCTAIFVKMHLPTSHGW